MDYKTVQRDIKIYTLIKMNENYKSRLKEAYDYIKNVGVESSEDFTTREGLKVGAFTYDEITIFDRIKDEEYLKFLEDVLYALKEGIEYSKNEKLGDELASWGTLGDTPYREDLIKKGMIIEGLTSDERKKHMM